ncbi:hypothetical protein [Enterococcus casseliflavus]|jgi:hypothetical protein|uniref:hypothetical protein n=1 Tax=Enterococcus casseliflavus TaxID=37734 RepID=UPI000FFBA8F1|nr:hypothetical protein [Enterococcus casseliflavus]RXA62694.1 hypothetical protein EQ871_11920 [Enterococcus casseliflavus]
MVKFTLFQLLSLVDKGVDVPDWDTFEKKTQQKSFLVYLESNHQEHVPNGISTPIEFDKVNNALLDITNAYSSFAELKAKYPIDNNNLLLVTTALLDFLY